MKKRARRNHSPVFKAKVALASIKGDRTVAQLSEAIRPPQIIRITAKRRREDIALEPGAFLLGLPCVPHEELRARCCDGARV
jgi:transposase